MSRLHEIQQSISIPKNRYSSFGKYSYRSCEDILDGLKKLLQAGETVTVSDEIVNIGNRNYVKSTVALALSDTTHMASAFACEAENQKGMDSAQITGSASSYARKYALNGLLALDDIKDADSTNRHGQETQGSNGGSSVSMEELKKKYPDKTQAQLLLMQKKGGE